MKVPRSTEALDRADTSDLAHLPCMAPAGAGVLTGTADALVAATGRDSTMGRVAALLEQSIRSGSLLERQVNELSRFTAVVAVLCGTAALALAIFLRGTDLLTALVFGTGVIVALVPEGLLPLLTVSLAMGARRMAARGALVRRLSAIEVVGATTVIGTDKTGTLTQSSLAVLRFVPWRFARDPQHRAQLVAALCNDSRKADGQVIGDPTDRALVRWVESLGVDLEAVRAQHPRTSDLPFDPHRRYMRVQCAFPGGERQLLKGAPEAISAVVEAPIPAELADVIAEAAARGERVLMLAEGPAGELPECLGLLRLQDPPRPEVPAAVAACRRAGIRVVMFTGDHAATARGIATQIGLVGEHTAVIEGTTLDALDDRGLLAKLRAEAIFARTMPEQKLRVVRVLQAAGEVVTVTGDGVNDAPALRMADVGIAMGRRGTEVAKQASGIVLLDENFATIIAAIEDGRTLKKNIQKFVSYVFTSNIAELVPFVCYVVLPIPLPLTILQVLAIELGTDMLPALALGLEPPSPRTLDAPPEPPRSPLLTRALALRTFLFYGMIEAGLGMAAFLAVYWAHGWRPFASFEPFGAARLEAATLTFLGIVGGQVGCLFAQREGSLRARLSLRGNPWIAIGLGFELALALALVYAPGVNAVFSMTGVAPAWLAVLPIGAAIMILADHVRRVRRSGARPR
jgi:calcium-translocating P-type ATPase